MGKDATDEPRGEPERLTVAQAAERLGINEGALRSRIKRGTVPTVRVGGRVYVLLGAGEPEGEGRTYQDEPYRDRLIAQLESRVASLERQLEAEREAHAEARRIIAGLVQRIPALEGPPEARESPQTPAEASGRTYDTPARPQEASRRPAWWRRIFGG